MKNKKLLENAKKSYQGYIKDFKHKTFEINSKEKSTKQENTYNQNFKKSNIHRGDIYIADLENNIGSEQGGIRPVIIVQNEMGNIFSPTTIICPITSKPKRKLPTHVIITPNDCDIRKDSIILCEQIRAIDKSRLKSKIGSLNNQKVREEFNRKIKLSTGVM
ncbi:MAG: type II toxin-antitoxin system PemK/MazF family toxin [Clostridia bacterium]|nr:type II toxin-antitoxin system PemK/MazF family toxin [Clostridia bacterium]